ncbi:F0F1 ATP synthase subunit gamma [Sphingomonas histidinilytica]|jgi:F-type H+-transporting ATPase subunit gamma|uniref:ATP synthase gamma chain n=1 Tax=Rhizorhabdus histidinilytica TaxID=439228 RepID=A0A1T5F741_9SPHN|nr:F0F1 ATP synthase subunit gamma [Rhizorhabdus histidinilytica]MBO9379536.1 F0F1 ATP synthase subunit gamma [Rhizorhabdus histidinilytica]QEH77957.1 F0F1 ATP synthase subunit gamma [Sphingomonas sp. C8-2]SKB91940.1 ATP synthase F1 subcomplex gamma subunit [Rhizorhabdus histidinilytica]
MPSLKSLKVRITSVKSTQKITKAMKMVAAAKLRRAQQAAEAGRPYAERLNAVMASLASKVTIGPQSPKLLAGTGSDQVHLLVVATSERGLAGAFNTNIVRAARKTADALIAEGKTVKFYLIGKKGRAVIARLYPGKIVHQVDQSHIKNVAFSDAHEVAEDLIGRYAAGEFDVAHLFFAKFQSALVQEPTELQIIPVPLTAGDDAAASGASAAVEYEPDEEAILTELLPRNVAIQLFRAMLENAASEQGSRMTAMDNATRNAGDMINRLTIQYNRTRQAAITTELVEIISGAEAL